MTHRKAVHNRISPHKTGHGHPLLAGLVAGAAGSVALNVVTYADMAIRGRAASSMPDQAVGKLAKAAGVSLDGEGGGADGNDDEKAAHRTQGLGALLGYAVGIGVGIVYGVLAARTRVPLPAATLGLGAAAMAGSDLPLITLGLTDPRKWSGTAWAADVVPHLAYGAAAATAHRLVAR